MKTLIKNFLNMFRNYGTQPIVIMYSGVIYLVLEVVFGSKHALNYLRCANQVAIVPILRLRGASVGKGTVIQEGLTIHNANNFRNLKIGKNCHIGKNCFLDLRAKIDIADNVVIAMNCELITHLDMTNSELSVKFPASYAPIVIEESVYIGVDTVVLMGVTLRKKSFIGAKSLVNKDTENGKMYFGIPAKMKREIHGPC